MPLQSSRVKIFPSLLLCSFILATAPSSSFSQNTKAGDESDVVQTEVGIDHIEGGGASSNRDESRQMATINEALKRVIEENKALSQEKNKLTEELKSVRRSSEMSANRVGSLTDQNNAFQKRIAELEEASKNLAAQVDTLNGTIASQQKEFGQKLAQKDEEITQKKNAEDKAVAEILSNEKSGKGAFMNGQELQNFQKSALAKLSSFEDATKKVITEVSKFETENKKLKVDSAELHYNLGNSFFEQGEYEKAAKEYAKTIEMIPSDAEAHYNLAFVSAEFLADKKTALEHYQQYLFLNPHADDEALVREKILELQLESQTKIQSLIDRPEKRK